MKTKDIKAFIIIDKRGVKLIHTLRELRKDCISEFLSTTITWKEAKKYGWKCKKVNVKIEILW